MTSTLSVKRKPESCAPSKQKNSTLSASTASTDLPNSNNLSLDVLKHMIHEVEHEMEEYERWTGREVQKLQNSQGLTGFTLSLVSSLCRLVRYLKEVRVWGYYSHLFCQTDGRNGGFFPSTLELLQSPNMV